MRNQQTINQILKASELDNSFTFNKAVSYIYKNINHVSLKKNQAFEILKDISKASVKIQHTQRVVESTIKKLKSMGFEIEEVENHVHDFGRVDRWVIITK